MLAYLHYVSAVRRLEEFNKTIKLMGGEHEAPNQLMAQRDMIRLEKEYYADRCVMWNFILGFAVLISVSIYVIMFRL